MPAIDSGLQPPTLTDYRYNDDLLRAESSREHAKAEFPQIFHVLDNPDLRAAFEPIDNKAGEAKRRSQHAGFWAVVLAVLSLMGAAAEPVWRGSPWPWPAVLPTATALLGLTAVLLGAFGVLHGRQKDQWLHHRLCTERLRQFQFQAFIWTLPEIARAIADGEPHGVQRFIDNRRKAFIAFTDRLTRHPDARLAAVVAPTGGAELWLYEARDSPPTVPTGFDPDQLFRAYRRLRFEEQLSYPEHKLGIVSFTLALRGAPLRNQRQTLRAIWTAAFSALIALHVALIVGHFAGWLDVHRPLLHIAVIWTALIALGARTLVEGLGVSREIERYEDYRAAVFDARERFDRAKTAEEKLRAMMDMERISFEEMRTFLRTAREASFVL